MAFLFASVALLSLGACTEKSAQTVLHQIGSGGKSIKASGNYVTKSYSVGKFSTIEASGVATVVYTQTSGPQKVEVCTSDNLMEYVYVKVNDGNLLVGIKYDGAIQSLDKFEVRVSSPSLSGVDLRGASRFVADGAISARRLDLSLSGASRFSGASVSCTDLDVDASGSSNLSLGKLKAKTASFDMSGASKVDVDQQVEKSTIGLSGASKAFVKGTAVDADYSTSGAANVNAEKCVAQRVSASASGASKVNCHAVASLKVDRSGAYMARYVAKNIVAAGLADVCTVSLAYAIGQTEPVAVEIDTQESGYYDDAFLTEAVRRVFDFTPAGMIRALDLDKPFFAEVCNNCHFMHPQAAWEQTDKAEKLRMACAELEDERT